jgi:hypothetical protein
LSLVAPVWARPGRKLYRVLVEGSGVTVPVRESTDFIRGFFSTRVVAAVSPEEAARLAFEAVITEWRNSGFQAAGSVSGTPTLVVSELHCLSSRVCFRPPRGFSLYTQLG